jgi:hypothetical protein
MSISLPPRRTRPAPSTSTASGTLTGFPNPHAKVVAARARSLTAARGLAFFVALLVLLASLPAEAKKKKGAKKHKPAATGAKSTKSDRGLPPPDESASDEEDEKPASKKAAPEADESEEKKAPPPAPEPEDQPVKKPAKAAKAAPSEGGAGAGAVLPVALQIGLGGKALFRNLVWTQDMGALAPYSLTPGPEVSGWLETYPAAFATDGFAANIGLYGSFNYGIGASSKTPAGQMLTTKYHDFMGGLKVRIPVGSFIPYVAAAYGLQTFHLDPPSMAMDRPNFTYGLVHLGGGARIYFTPEIDLDVNAGYLLVNIGKAAGEVGATGYYPGATAYGVDAGLSLGFRITGMIGVRAGVDFRQIGLSLHWRMQADNGIMAGGAVDRYIGLWGGLEVTFDGLGGGGGGESEAPASKKPAKAKKAPAPDSESEGSEKSEKEEAPSDVE